MSTIRKRGDIWWYFERHQGKKIQKTLRTTDKNVAKLKQKEWDYRLSIGESIKSEGKLLLKNCIEGYLSQLKLTSGKRHHQCTSIRLWKFFNFTRITYLKDVERSRVVDFFVSLREDGIKPQTIRQYKCAIKAMIYWCIDEGLTTSNPLDRIKMERPDKIVVRSLNTDEVKQLLSVDIYPIKYMCAFTLYTGMRASEVRSARWEWFDFNSDMVNIVQCKTKKIIPVPLIPEFKRIIEPIVKDSGLCFSYKGKPYEQIPNKLWVQLRRETGVNTTFIELRHTFATNCYDVLKDIRAVQYLLGHSKLTMTERYINTVQSNVQNTINGLTYRSA